MGAALAAAAAVSSIGLLGAGPSVEPIPPLKNRDARRGHQPRYVRQWVRKRGWGGSGDGTRERERRLRQIARGSLRHENGLDSSVPAFGLTIRQYREQELEARAAAFEAWRGGGGFIGRLTEAQKQSALAYRGEENHGDPAYHRAVVQEAAQ